MSANINGLPLELYYKIIPNFGLDARTLCAYSRTSKFALAMIYNIAGTYRGDPPNDGIWNNYTNICDASLRTPTCIFEILKFRIKERYPQHHHDLVRDILRFRVPQALNAALKPFGEVFRDILRFRVPQALNAALKPFGEVLCNVIYLHKDPDLAELILVQSESNDIPGTSNKFDVKFDANLGDALRAVILHLKSPKLVRMILSLPNAKDIVGYKRDATCLGTALVEAVRQNSLELTKLVLSHPNAAEIRGSIDDDPAATYFRTLLGALLQAINVNNPKLVYKIVNHPNAKSIPLDEMPGLGVDPLTMAIDSQNPLLIAAVLHLPEAIDLPVENLIEAGKAMLSEEDRATLLQLHQMLEHKKLFKLQKFGETFITLTAGAQYLFYLLLCKTHGRLNQTIAKDGMVHLIKKPDSLLPLIDKLI
jgi:hypothetical protein